jgi:HK97 family phage prohead protease
MPNVKTARVHIKAAGDQDGTPDGVFEAIVATYDLDSYGDKIVPGAFADTLAEWKASGDPLPVLWAHQSGDPESHIGVVLEAEERPEGLWVKAQLDPDELADRSSRTAKVYKLLKGRRVTQFSFAFDVEEGAWVEKTEGGVDTSYYELRKLKLFEVGPCLVGVNQQTDLLAIKAAERPQTSGAPWQRAVPDQQPDLQGVLLTITSDLADIKARLDRSTHDDTATPTTPLAEQTSPPKAADAPPAKSGTASLRRALTDLALLEAEVPLIEEGGAP